VRVAAGVATRAGAGLELTAGLVGAFALAGLGGVGVNHVLELAVLAAAVASLEIAAGADGLRAAGSGGLGRGLLLVAVLALSTTLAVALLEVTADAALAGGGLLLSGTGLAGGRLRQGAYGRCACGGA